MSNFVVVGFFILSLTTLTCKLNNSHSIPTQTNWILLICRLYKFFANQFSQQSQNFCCFSQGKYIYSNLDRKMSSLLSLGNKMFEKRIASIVPKTPSICENLFSSSLICLHKTHDSDTFAVSTIHYWNSSISSCSQQNGIQSFVPSYVKWQLQNVRGRAKLHLTLINKRNKEWFLINSIAWTRDLWMWYVA